MHILVVGGSGMLKEACLTLAQNGHIVSVIGRSMNKLEELKHIEPSIHIFNLISLDYTDSELLKSKLAQTIKEWGPIECAICWIHSTAPQAPYIVAEHLKKDSPFFHLFGSAFADPSKDPQAVIQSFSIYPIQYHPIVLGFILEENTSRWLTHKEISQGVLKAFNAPQAINIIGTVNPWSARP